MSPSVAELPPGRVTPIVGTQWGDEGKGRFTDLLGQDADVTARYAGGDNAGHTVNLEGDTFKLNLMPSAVLNPDAIKMIGQGVVLNPVRMTAEAENLIEHGVDLDPSTFMLDPQCQLVLTYHSARDLLQEATSNIRIGTTGRGMGPAHADRTLRIGPVLTDLARPDYEQFFLGRLHDNERVIQAVARGSSQVLEYIAEQQDAAKKDPKRREMLDALERAQRGEQVFDEKKYLTDLDHARQFLLPFVGDTVAKMREVLSQQGRVLAEGAQGALLDITHGEHPFVTPSHPGVNGIFSSFPLGGNDIHRAIGVMKAFSTRVGGGSMPTELFDETALALRGTGANPWDEFGTTTGRPRRVGWLDLLMLSEGVKISGATELAVTKLDILAGLDPVNLCVAYNVGGTRYTKIPRMDRAFLQNAQPIYENYPGWSMPNHPIEDWDDLPVKAQQYLRRIEGFVGLPISFASFGPERNQLVYRS